MAVSQKPLRDPNTLSNYNEFRTIHTTASFDIQFKAQHLTGNVRHQLRSTTDSQSRNIVLDSSYLQINDVKADEKAVKWHLKPREEPYGSALVITLDCGVPFGQDITIEISVQTTDKCTALQWLTPEQTSNGKHPYMFSQCQAIHARSVFPCQDTPDVKATFTFNISSALPVIASGVALGTDVISVQPLIKKYRFEQKVPIPSYLFALASGDIVQAPIGPYSKVATSPDHLKECQWELEADVEKFLDAIGLIRFKDIVFPYVWGEYNVLILPPSFPYGGMENPVYTFATPSIISKDRQNIDVIAHEISHSWSGNLVTNCSWEHFWLNEGWTTYLERRIQAAIHGEPHRHFSAIIGWKQLADAVERYGNDHEFTKLVVDLKGKDPDDAFSTVPYEKGFIFIFFLENLIGKEKFDKFIPHYFMKFRGQSLDSFEFKSCLENFFTSDRDSSVLLADVDWNAWFYKPGLPPKPHFDMSLVNVVYDLAKKWRPQAESPFSPSPSDIADLVANQLVVFLEQILLFETPLTAEQSETMGKTYRFAESENIEVSNLYFQVGLKARDKKVVEPVVKLLGRIGRMKFVRPLYRALKKYDINLALDTFAQHKTFYHPICRGLVEKDLLEEKIG
ncbi:Leucyl aminopeptidase yscIV [Ophidiomyces ophidiicola]|nr:Leucyl aminopeptidase yscIV [Ophidiomyces ophidiicola]KAI1987827.1 Leucyl aminopeptidase yscIV [Ophidiomyces ophidiicola]